MNSKVPVWSDDGWEAAYNAACEPYEENNKPPRDDINIRIEEENLLSPYTGNIIKIVLKHPCVIESTFESNIRCKLHPKNGVIEIDSETKPNYFGCIKVYVKYHYEVPISHSESYIKSERYAFPGVGQTVVDMRTFTGVIIDSEFLFGYCKKHFVNGLLHKEEGPAIESLDGKVQIWYRNGVQHRDSGPSYIVRGERKYWFKDGKPHRVDGPAKEFYHPPIRAGKHEYYLNGEEYSKEDFDDFLRISAKLKAKFPGGITKAINENAGTTIKTGIPKLDAACQGIPKGKLTTIYGQTEDSVKLKNISDLLELDKIKKEGGSRCKKCNTFNEYIVKPNWVCYSCRNG